MAQSREYLRLIKRLGQLEKLLPAPSATGTYSLEEQDRIRAFRVLAHAECESFIEKIAAAAVARAEKEWKRSSKATSVMRAVAHAFCRDRQVSAKHTRYDHGLKQFREVIKKNNGLKEKNLCAIFLPLGLDETVLNVTWLQVMDTFGHERGIVAHGSVGVVMLLDPKNEKARLAQVISGLATVDEVLRKLR
jgi:hypothetical protein